RLGEMVSNWDVRHFEQLALSGDLGEPDGILMAFFPGLPAVLSFGLSNGIPVALTGVIVSLAGSGVAAAALLRLGGPWAAVAWLFAPTAVFTTVPYTESLFCAAAFWAWERARADRWWAAAVLTAAACTLRVSGLFLVGALLVMILTSVVSWRDKITRAAQMLLPLGVILAFAGYLYLLTGSWTAWYSAQKTGWVRELTWPWQSFLNTIPAIVPGAYADHPWWAAVFRGEMASMAVGLGVVAWCIAASIRARRSGQHSRFATKDEESARAHDQLVPSNQAAVAGRQKTGRAQALTPSRSVDQVLLRRTVDGRRDGSTLWGEASWVGVQVLAFSLSYWFFSVNRATLLWFPLWILVGRWVVWRPRAESTRVAHRVLVGVAFGAEIVLMLWWSWLFFTGHWAS
ncbi:MAG TPA: hypothetical protein VGW74_13720, partial [Propionibacteriaceae bacterium]|nr:hypothetical protein [Propionibacteriaceae bacterium]